MDGILNIYKEKGYTSHDVVARMRGILKMKKIGHTGTLDPDAEGVLPVCVGAATKLCDLLTDKTKSYETVMHLGIETDTQDIGGKILCETSLPEELSEQEILRTVAGFEGEYAQIPPMYSALKVNGRKLYEYARKGVEIERQPRMVNIFQIEVTNINLPYVTMRVNCSKGTYIRTLCADIGAKLGAGACMESLLRTRVAGFALEKSIRLSELEHIVQTCALDNYLVKIESLFSSCERVWVCEEGEKYLYNGNGLKKEWLSKEGFETENADTDMQGFAELSEKFQNSVRVYNKEKQFIGLYIWEESKECMCPQKLFFINNGG